MYRLATGLIAAFLAAAAGCTPAQYAQQADRAAYGMLTAGQRVSLGAERPFDVSYNPFPADNSAIRVGEKVIHVGAGEAAAISLDDCLGIAFRNSRELQTRREALYSAALALANARRTWDWSLVGGEAAAAASHERVAHTSETNAATGEVGPTLTQRFVDGGILALGLTLDFATDFFGGAGTTAGSLIEANFTQPLLRGACRGLAYEDQYRLERDFYIAVFTYERFTQTFAADIIRRYYDVLEQRDQLENEAANIARLKETLELTQTLVAGGQVSRIQQDQAEQDLLNAQVRYERSRQSYQDALDAFKITLGLPVEAMVEAAYQADLEALRRAGPRPIPFDEAQAVEVALAVRPDVLTARAAVRDARRDVLIAADQFNPRLDLALDLSIPSKESRNFWQPRLNRHTRGAGVEFQYDLDQTDNRDAYRNALIAQARSERDYDAFVDGVRLDVRRAYRALMQSRRSHELQKRNVEIALRRRTLAVLQQREGLASARDVLEAEEALRSAQNGLTSALLGYTTTRLTFLAQLGMISVDEEGKIHERDKPLRADRLNARYK